MRSERTRLSKENRKDEKFIEEADRELYMDMMGYLRCAKVSLLNQEKIRKTIIEKIQEGDKDINVDELVSQYPAITEIQEKVAKTTLTLNSLGYFGFYTIFVSVMKNLYSGNPWMNYQITAADIVIFAMFYGFIYFVVTRIKTGKFDMSKIESKFVQTFGLWLLMIPIVLIGDVAYKYLGQYGLDTDFKFAVISYALILLFSKIIEVKHE